MLPPLLELELELLFFDFLPVLLLELVSPEVVSVEFELLAAAFL